MNPFKYAQMMKYLTRVKKQKPDLPDVFSASEAPIPKVKDSVATKDAINRFVRANPRTEKAGGGMLVQPGFGGTRQGYAGKKGYVKPLSPELQKLFNKTNPGEEWGKGRFADEKARGNWKNDAPRKQKILNATSNLITEDQLAKILTEELGEEITRAKIFGKYGVGQRTKFAETIDNLLFKGKFGSIKGGKDAGGSIRYFKKPSQNDIKKILKSGTLGDVRINTLKTNTVKNILTLNKKYADIYKAGNIPDIELVMKATGMTEQSAGTATARLAQIYNGHKFNNKELKGIRVNKKTASKMFEIMDKSPFGNPYRNSLYKVSLATIDQKLGNEVGTFEGLKKKATKILKDNKIPIYDFKKGDKAFGFNINEIAGVTGSAKSKAAEFSQFIDIMEGNLNQKTLANFQGQLSIARQNIENNPNMLSSESKRINKLARSLEREYDVELPRLRDPDATKYFSPARIRELNAQGIDVVKAAERAGYTVQMPKSAVTIQEFVKQTPKAVKGLSAFMKTNFPELKCSLSKGVNCNDPQAYQRAINEYSQKAAQGDEAAKATLSKFSNKVATAGKLIKGALGPLALATEVAIDLAVPLNTTLQEGIPFKQAFADTLINKYILGPKLQVDKEAEIAKEMAKGEEFAMAKRGERMMIPQSAEADAQRLKQREEERLALFPDLQFANPSNQEIDQILKEQGVFSPFTLGFGMQQKQPGIGDTKYNEEQAYNEIRDLINKNIDERVQSQQMQNIATAGGVANLAGGGIAKLAGDRSGAMLESMNPDSQGLQGLMKRVKNR